MSCSLSKALPQIPLFPCLSERKDTASRAAQSVGSSEAEFFVWRLLAPGTMSALTLDGTRSSLSGPLPHPCGPSKDGCGGGETRGCVSCLSPSPIRTKQITCLCSNHRLKRAPQTGRNSELCFTAGEIEAQRVSMACCPSQSKLVPGPELWSLESVHCSFPSPWNVHYAWVLSVVVGYVRCMPSDQASFQFHTYVIAHGARYTLHSEVSKLHKN